MVVARIGRFFATVATATARTSGSMSAWQLNSYSESPGLVQNRIARIPTIERPGDVLIRVHAASVNPLDVQMADGFGRSIIGILRQIDQRTLTPPSEFPLTLGRDCSGVVVDAGRNVRNVKQGDEVWCAIAANRQGTFAEYVAVDSCCVAKKPKNLTHVQAAAMPYVACTVWSTLDYGARVNERNAVGSNALVFGAAGGIGTFAVQLLSTWGANVTAVCRSDSHNFVKGLGASGVIDYEMPDAWDQLVQNGPYDIIYDPVFSEFSRRSADLLKYWKGSRYIAITNPLLDDCDRLGLAFGFFSSATTFSKDFLKSLFNGRVYLWAYVIPDGRILTKLARLVEEEKVRPVVEKVFHFDDLPLAFEKVAQGRGRGKVVVDVFHAR